MGTGAVLGGHTHIVQQKCPRRAVAARVAGLVSPSRGAKLCTGGRALGTVQPLLAWGTHTRHWPCTGLQATGGEVHGAVPATPSGAIPVATATGHRAQRPGAPLLPRTSTRPQTAEFSLHAGALARSAPEGSRGRSARPEAPPNTHVAAAAAETPRGPWAPAAGHWAGLRGAHHLTRGTGAVVAGVQLGHCSWCIELPMQLAGALTEGQAAGVVQEEARGAGAARGAEAGALHPRALCQTQLRARAPLLVALLC